MSGSARLGEPTLAEAFLARNPRLDEDYLRGLVADLDARLSRVTERLEGQQTPTEVIAEVRRFHLDRPFQAARPQAGLDHWRWNRDWEALVAAIGTSQMRDGVAQRREREAAQAAEVRARMPSASSEPAATTPSHPPVQTWAKVERTIRDVTRVAILLGDDRATAADYADARLGPLLDDGERLAARLEREAARADRAEAEQGRASPDDGLADDERRLAASERYWTPARALNRVMRPATRALARHRRAERAVERAGGRLSARRAVEELARVRQEWDVAAVLAADLDAERALLRPIVQAAIDGTSRRWRHKTGHVFDAQGVSLYPPCLRSWQVL